MRKHVNGRIVVLALALAGCATGEEIDSSADHLAAAGGGRYIVKFKEGRGPSGKAALAAAGASLALELGPQNAVAARIPAEALAGLQHNPSIEYIEEDEPREPYATWSDRSVGGEILPFGVQMVQGDLVTSPDASNRTICIIDSGYSQQHVDLRDESSGAIGFTPTSGTGTWDQDSCGHGTHVAGTIAAIAGNEAGVVGVNPGVKLHIVKVVGDDDLAGASCAYTFSSNLIDALNKCSAAGANVVSMSLGGDRKTRTEQLAFDSADAAGVLSIAAAGNGGSRRAHFPAAYGSVISVSAIDANEAVASFSEHNADVELAAPGVAVLSTVPWREANTLDAGDASWSGTHVEGSARAMAAAGTIVDGGQCTSAGFWAGAIVLCQRGTNTFAAKVDNVKAGGGIAAVIYNNVTSDATCGDFTGGLGDGVTSTIPAISVTCEKGAAALAAAGTPGSVTSQVFLPESGYEAWNGTSMATPHVSAVAALIWSCDPTKTNAQIRDALDRSARDLGAAGRDIYYGFGVVQAKAALQLLGLGSCTVL